jgi:hypothetical protein
MTPSLAGDSNAEDPMAVLKSVLDNLVIVLHQEQLQKSYDKEYARALVDCARRDLRACVLLRSQGDLPNAIYHLQQASEKLVKAYGLITVRLTESEVRSVSHATPGVFIQMLQKKWARQLLDIARTANPKTQIPYPDLHAVSGSLKTNRAKLELARMSKGQIKALLSLENVYPEAAKDEETKKRLDKALDYLEANPDKVLSEVKLRFPEDDSTTQDVFDAVKHHRSGDSGILEESTTASILYVIAAVTFPHEAFTRYPDGELKPADYVEGLGIVDAAGAIVSRLEKCLARIEEVYLKPRSR